VQLLFADEYDEDDDMEYHPAPGDSQEEEDDDGEYFQGEHMRWRSSLQGLTNRPQQMPPKTLANST
jgi:hypothetical protein